MGGAAETVPARPSGRGGVLARALITGLVVLLVAVLGSWAVLSPPWALQRLELAGYDLRMRARGELPATGRVVVVAVDARSVAEVGRWPWSRATAARLVRGLAANGVAAAAFDIGYFDPQPDPGRAELLRLRSRLAEAEPGPAVTRWLQERLAEPGPDQRLARALRDEAMPVVLGCYFDFHRDVVDPGFRESLRHAARYPMVRALPGAGPTAAAPGELPVPEARGGRAALPGLARAAGAQGYFNITADPDGVVRRAPMAVRFAGELYQPLAAALYGLAMPGAMPAVLTGPDGVAGMAWGGNVAPTDPSGRMLINYRGPAGAMPTIPAWRVLAGQDLRPALEGKWAVVGVTAPGIFDMRATPYDPAVSGVEIQATLLDTLLGQAIPARPGWADMFDIAAVFALCALAALLSRLRPLGALPAAALVAGCYALLAHYLLAERLYWVGVATPLAAFAACFLLLGALRWSAESARRARLARAFGRYMEPGVAARVAAGADKPGAGHRLDCSVLFCGLRGVTGAFAPMADSDVAELASDCLAALAGAVEWHGGAVDTVLGMGLMAVFSDREGDVSEDDAAGGHALRACRAALDLEEAMAPVNEKWRDRGLGMELRPGAGVASGEALAGTFGTPGRVTHTVVGLVVRRAARLERLTGAYGIAALIDGEAFAQVRDSLWLRPVDRIPDQAGHLDVHQPLAGIDRPRPMQYLGASLDMVASFRAGRFGQAMVVAETLARAQPDDPLPRLYLRRCRRLAADPPQRWNGVCAPPDIVEPETDTQEHQCASP